MVSQQNIFLLAFFIITGFIFWITFLVLYKNEPIPYITRCSNDAPCDLTNYGALIVGLVASILIAYLIWRSQAIHSEKLAKLSRNVTEKIYARTISHYAITMKYYEENNDSTALENALKYFQNLVNLLVQQGKSVKDIEIFGKGMAKEIELDAGIVKITVPKIKKLSESQEAPVKSIKLYLQTESYKLLNKLIAEHRLVYHHLEWHIVGPYPIESMMNQFKNDVSGLSDCAFEDMVVDDLSSSTIRHITKLNKIEICVAIHQHNMNLICSYEGSRQGFYRAHELLTPAKIIPILFGEIGKKEVDELFENAMKLETN